MSRSAKFHLLIASWICVLLFMAGMKQYQVMTGQKILLDVTPVDPRHPFMGAYVRLNFPISSVKVDPAIEYRKGASIYVTLTERGGVWEAAGASRDIPPDGAFYIKGIMHRPPWTLRKTHISLAEFQDVDPEGWIDSNRRKLDKLKRMEIQYGVFNKGDRVYIAYVDDNRSNRFERNVIHKNMNRAIKRLANLPSFVPEEKKIILSAIVQSFEVHERTTVRVKYGIEKYFATEKKALEYETLRNQSRLMVEAYITPGGAVTLGEMIIKPKN